MKRGSTIALAALAALASLTTFTCVQAQERKVLKYAHVFAANHPSFNDSFKQFEEAVTKATGGRIQWENYHAGAIGKEGVSMLNSGITDTAILMPSYEPAKLPLGSVSELPGLYSNSCEATAKLWHISKDGGPLNEVEYKPQGLKVLYVVIQPAYKVITSKKKVSTLEDMSGLKIRANGAAMDKTVRALGAVPVRVTGGELYDSLTRGTVDGGIWPINVNRSLSLEKVVRYTTMGPMVGSGAALYGMSQKVWDGLSGDDKAAITKASMEAMQRTCAWLDNAEASELALLSKDHGFVATSISGAELARWTERIAPIAAEWAKEMDATGRPGSALLKAFKEAPGRF
jgi:TRAP-type C4-dicarboxylate transport system substrate-binding protein